MDIDSPSNGNGTATSLTRIVINEQPEERLLLEEIKTCRSIASRCAFVLGPARSGTTILAQIINANDRALLTTEANFYQAGSQPVFRDWYNHQHKSFKNQISKVSYAPNFTYPGEHQWWKWLARAGDFFDVVGDKMAFIDHHMGSSDSSDFMSFFESRFFDSRYLFIFRDPVQTILSSAVLWNKDPLPLIRSWASIVKLWADFIRIFPFTMTILHGELNESKIAEIGAFLGLDLRESSQLLNAREQRQHLPGDIERGAFATKLAPLLQMIYSEIKDSLEMERVFLQADQKRGGLDGMPWALGRRNPDIAVVSTSVGQAWNLADRLVNDLQVDMPA
jgi:hypothetical protein